MTSPTTKRQRTLTALALLQARFPALFPAKPSDVRPLALGIHQALVGRLASESGADPKGIGWALRKWCQREGYKRALARGGNRIDLDGRPVEPVTEEHRRNALVLVDDLDADRRAKAQLRPKRRGQASIEMKKNARPIPPPRSRPPQRQPERSPSMGPSPSNSPVRAVEVIIKKRRRQFPNDR